jgi:pimeloyl-ACP methyl ester carboxylesterase
MTQHFFEAEDGARLAYRDEGEGFPLFMLAGLTRDSRDFDYLLRHNLSCRVIRLDSRGRGSSAWTGHATYNVAQEAKDALALLDHLGVAQVAILGTSRGGLLGMIIAATARHRLLGLCFNDVGPKLEKAGLLRIAEYVGVKPSVTTLQEIVDRLPNRSPGFANVPDMRWAEEALRHFTENADGIGLTYDPDLGVALTAALQGPLPEVWQLFDACAGLPLALIRGANSDVLSAEAAAEMQRRRPDMLFVDVPDRGHTPFLDEPQSLDAIRAWLDQIKRASATPDAGHSHGG